MIDYVIIIAVLLATMVITIITKKLTVAGALTAGVVGLLVFAGAGYTGVAMLATFFVLGTAATSWKMHNKQQLGVSEKNKGQRTAEQVLANGGMPALLGLISLLYKSNASLFVLLMAASFASATADTLSSELGNVYGTRFYNILNFKKDTRGLDGVVSAEGTLIGLLGSTIIASICAFHFGVNSCFFIIIIAGTIGNISDSILGATAERKGFIKNNTVNFLNTGIAAIVALLLQFVI